MPWFKYTSCEGEKIAVPFYTEDDSTGYLVDLIELTGPYDAIKELGCAYGQNLYKIYYKGGPVDVPYYGREFTKSGEDLGRTLAKATPGMNIEFFHFNHLEPDLSFIKGRFEQIFIFTSYTIEAVYFIPGNWIEKVYDVAPFVRCAMIEPFGFQIKDSGEITRRQVKYAIGTKYNLNLAHVVNQYAERNEIRIEDLMLEHVLSRNYFNPSSLVVWSHGDDKYPQKPIQKQPYREKTLAKIRGKNILDNLGL